MPVPTAEIVFLAIAATMFVVWAIGTRFALSRVHWRGRSEPDDVFRPEAEADPDVVQGEVELAGDRDSLSKKIAERLAAPAGPAGGSLLRITARTQDRVSFEAASGGVAAQAGAVVGPGEIALVQDGPRVRARYSLRMHRFARAMRLAAYLVCFVYGGLFVIGVPAILWLFVVHHPDERVRWQVFQTAQMVHGVWPPFLVGYIGSRLRNSAAGFIHTLLANLAHTA